MKCAHCDNEAVYTLSYKKTDVLYVCEQCDENYGICTVCGQAVLREDMRFLNPADEYMTCYDCVPYGMTAKEAHEAGEAIFEGLRRGLETSSTSTLASVVKETFNNAYHNALIAIKEVGGEKVN